MSKMTARVAQAEAVRRWGVRGRVRKIRSAPNPRTRCAVGVIVMGMFFEVRGQGATFEEAFENASKYGSL